MTAPYYDHGGIQIYNSHVLTALSAMPDESIQCVITSPPYWGLRDYGIEPVVWDEPAPGKHTFCDYRKSGNHKWGDMGPEHHPGQVQDNKAVTDENAKGQTVGSGQLCQLCGAWRGSLGLEPTPELFVQHIVQVFREVRRVLRKDGTLWLNLGSSYAGGQQGGKSTEWEREGRKQSHGNNMSIPPNFKPKDLIGIPWMVALALQADGWWLRSDIIWNKSNPMPESVMDRPTKAHEYLFLMTKNSRYYYDGDAVREVSTYPEPTGKDNARKVDARVEDKVLSYGNKYNSPAGRNKRTVWTIPTQPFPEAHFATFPEKLVEPCIKAGSTIGDTVMDIFAGSGTVLKVAKRFNRKSVGIEINQEYVEMAVKYLRQDMLPFKEAT